MKRVLAILAAAWAISSCATTPVEPQPPAPATADYQLGASDKLRIIVFGEDNLSGEFSVSPAGTIALPLIGEVKAAGVSPSDLQRAIATRLSAGYLRDPRVSVEVLTYRSFYVLGEVNKPGVYPFESGLTVLKAVATAQGYTYRADAHRVFIKHANDPKEHIYEVQSTTPVAPGDVIRVGERFF